MEYFITSMPTLTGGSGAAAFIITDGSFSHRRKLLGGVAGSAPQFNQLCRWGYKPVGNGIFEETLQTDAISILKYGVPLGERTWKKLLEELGWTKDTIDKSICHQIAEKNQKIMLGTLGIPHEKDFITYPFLGNMGTVSLPVTAAIAEEKGFLKAGDKVGFLGIGSGLNCLMLGWEW